MRISTHFLTRRISTLNDLLTQSTITPSFFSVFPTLFHGLWQGKLWITKREIMKPSAQAATQPQRHLAAILFTDIVGYTAMMQHNEQSAIDTVKCHRQVLETSIKAFGGKLIHYYGDGSLSLFDSATEAVQCAMQVQQELQKDPKVPLRIGIHVGEVLQENGQVYGDGVNIASRIQTLGIAGAVLFSKEVSDKISNRPEFKTVSLGNFALKNVDNPTEILALNMNGLAVPKRNEMEGKLKKGSKRANIFVNASFLVFLAGFLIFKPIINNSETISNEKTIAVLPFADMSPGKDQAFFADGIAEEIINSLTVINDLKVIGRTASFQFKGEKIDLKTVGKKLQAGMIMEGSIQRYGDRVRITVQVIRVNDCSHIWSEKYDRQLTDIFKIQDEISASVAEKLRLSLHESEKQTEPDAHSLSIK